MSIRISSLFTDNENNKIKIKDLQCVKINEMDIPYVKEEVRRIKKDSLIMFFISLFSLAIVYLIILVNYFMYPNETTVKDIFTAIIFSTSFTAITCYFGKGILISSDKYKKAQYGIVKGKFHMNPSGKSSSKKYYINAIFPETKGFLAFIECSKDAFNELSEGGCVLVVAFNKHTAHAIPVSPFHQQN